MKIRFNDDPKIVETVREGLRRKDGYCPCRLQRTPENICMCQSSGIRSPILTSRATVTAVFTIKKSEMHKNTPPA